MIDKIVIKKNFSRFAHLYDNYSTVQRQCAEKLIQLIDPRDFRDILDIGCGTGNYTNLLIEKFPLAKITAVDISPNMVKVAENKLKNKSIDFLVADAEDFNFSAEFELVSSNVTLQWFKNLEFALEKYKNLLKPKGMICFSCFGPKTFCELQESLAAYFGKTIKINSNSFLDLNRLKIILEKLFNNLEIKEIFFQEDYNSLSELLEKIKYTGARGRGIDGNGNWTAKTIAEIEKIYKSKFKTIKANYQVFFVKGGK